MNARSIDLTGGPDWETVMQRGAEEHLAACGEYYMHVEDHECWRLDLTGDCPEAPPNPAFAPFDGCDTCVVREVLSISLPNIVRAVLSGQLGPED